MKRTLIFALFYLALSGLAPAQVTRSRVLQWDDPDNPAGTVTKYTVYWGIATGGPYTLGKLDIPAGTLKGSVTLAKGTYYFVVTASNSDSESSYSNEATTTVQDNARKPINFRIVVGP